MTDKQPEALRLADWLELHAIDGMERKAAAELRRLHATNKELLEALKASEEKLRAWEYIVEGEWGELRSEEEMEADRAWSEQVYAARAAIAKATGGEPCQ